MRRVLRILERSLPLTLFIVAVVIAFGALTVTVARPPHGPVCECANIYLPVLCDDGHVYYNPCVADCAHAKNCVPTGGGGPIP